MRERPRMFYKKLRLAIINMEIPMKRHIYASLAVASAIVVFQPAWGSSTANLIVNGDFSLGNVAFTSDYVYNPSARAAQTYCVESDPVLCHAQALSYKDHILHQRSLDSL
jgi:hypothetical protein